MLKKRTWCLAKNIKLCIDYPILMGILNVTPDSFSDGGNYTSIEAAYTHCLNMLQEGATIIDVGGESTRPNAVPTDPKLEQKRIIAIIKKLAAMKNTIISVDTYNSSTAKLALQHGAHIINDVYGLQKDPELAQIVAHFKAGIIIMHTNRERKSLASIIEDQKYFFEQSLNIATKAGIKDESIALDPGFGFGKNYEYNIALFKHINELSSFNYPLVAATSRKKFLGTIANVQYPIERDMATAISSVLLRQKGFSIFRVHNVAYNKAALDIGEYLS